MKKEYRICVYLRNEFGGGELRFVMPVGEPLKSEEEAKKTIKTMLSLTPKDTYFIIPQYTFEPK